jgi:hypothetical protein
VYNPDVPGRWSFSTFILGWVQPSQERGKLRNGNAVEHGRFGVIWAK